MPELPEVETIVRTHRPRLEGRQIRAFASTWPKGVLPSIGAVRRAIVGRTITRLTRRAKFIVFHLSPADASNAAVPWASAACPCYGQHGQPSVTHGTRAQRASDSPSFLLIHLRMSGRFEWASRPPEKGTGSERDATDDDENAASRGACPLFGRTPSHIRATFDLDDGQRLLFCDARKFGRIIFTRDFPAATAGLGPEPLDRSFTPRVLANLLRTRRRQLKPLLLDQSVLAGLGNIYTDEALFRAGLHPAAKSDRLTDSQIRALHSAIRAVLREAIRRHGTTIDWIYPGGWMQKHLRVYGRTGEPCRRCQTPIVALRLAQRGTHICPRCQPLP